MESATVSTKGRVTIPIELRRKYDIKPGAHIVFEQKGNAIKMRTVKKASV